MSLFLVSLFVLLASGALALATGRWATRIGASGAVVGSGLGLVSPILVLAGDAPPFCRVPWAERFGGEFYLQIDSLSAFFLLPIFALSALAAIYGTEYLREAGARRRLGPHWFFYNLLVASMALVVVARNGLLFLTAWEATALASFFLVTFQDDSESVQQAGRTYLIATHLGTAFLIAMFALLGRSSGSLSFDRFAGGDASAIFLLAVIGFGTKAGFMPLHVWLPEAHPAAPSHVSALMSGVMIKTGIYGLARVLTFFESLPAWWGWVLVAIGLSSGILGVLFALAQHDLKRLLAYHSVENIGIIAIGLGVGVLGRAWGVASLALLGFSGGLLHVLNHALFKSLLFFGAGAVDHACGTREIDRLGGLIKKMPWTAAAFLVGAVAICGLPPLNGFVSEFLIYLGALEGSAFKSRVSVALLIAAIAGLALIGGLAVACFTKAFGIVFLGEARSEHGAHARESGWLMRGPAIALAAGCVLIGLFPAPALWILAPVLRQVAGPGGDEVLVSASQTLGLVGAGAAGFWILVGALAMVRRRLLAGRVAEPTGTWDCGYAAPTARMQYTASSFAQPLTDLFRIFLRTRKKSAAPTGYFPLLSSLSTETPDAFREALVRPAFGAVEWAAGMLRRLQHGRVQLYVLYIALTLLVLLVWKLGQP